MSDSTLQANAGRRTLEQRLWQLESERAIRDLCHRYADCADRRDWARFMTAFHDGATHAQTDIHASIPQVENTKFASGVFATFRETHHLIGNIEVRISGMKAVSQAYFTSTHIIPAAVPLDFLPEKRRPRNLTGKDLIWWVGGRYCDELSYRDGRWAIEHRTGIHDWEYWSEAVNGGFGRNAAAAPAPVDERLQDDR